MTTKQFWGCTALSTLGSLIVIGAIALMAPHAPRPADPTPAPAPIPAPSPSPTPPTDAPVAIADQKAKLKLSDGRTATFTFSAGASGTPGQGSLACAAAIGLDEVLGYTLAPVGDPPPPDPTPAPTPPDPNPFVPSPQPPTPAPIPPAASNLRVLFLYDPLLLIGMPAGQQAILASPELRSYLDKHCPLESGCAGGVCPLKAGKTPSYRFLPTTADVSRLSPVWQQTYRSTTGKAVPWMLAVDEAGQTVIDQQWPASVEDTLKLLQKFGGL